MASLVNLVIYLVIIGVIFGLLLYLVSIAPMPEPWKGYLRFAVMAVGIIMLIFFLLGLVSGGVPSLKIRGALMLPMLA